MWKDLWISPPLAGAGGGGLGQDAAAAAVTDEGDVEGVWASQAVYDPEWRDGRRSIGRHWAAKRLAEAGVGGQSGYPLEDSRQERLADRGEVFFGLREQDDLQRRFLRSLR